MNEDQFRKLLFEEEGTALDFKCEQYPLAGESDTVKSELLKDILAFANAWRRTDAFILVGVREVQGGPSEVVGLDHHLQDADLQQFVNSKTQRPLQFSYIPLTVAGKAVAAFHIPIQARPLYLREDFGKLQAERVYVRRGSSTAIASPDEIAEMGAGDSTHAAPELELELRDARQDLVLTAGVSLTCFRYTLPPRDSIPTYRVRGTSQTSQWPTYQDVTTNGDYYRELADFVRELGAHRPLRLSVANAGVHTAHDVNAIIRVDGPEESLLLATSSHLRKVPETSRRDLLWSMPNVDPRQDLSLSRSDGGWQAYADFGKVQPGKVISCGEFLCVGARESLTLTLKVALFADNLPYPLEHEVGVQLNVQEVSVTLDELEDVARRLRGKQKR